MNPLGTFEFHGLDIEVQRSVDQITGSNVYWLRTVGTEPSVTVGVRREKPTALNGLFGIEQDTLDAALDSFLANQEHTR